MIKHALNVTRAQNFAGWYQEVISEADLAEESGVRGCMVIRPWGYGMWERIQKLMDAEIKAAGVENCYFPLFIRCRSSRKRPTMSRVLPRKWLLSRITG